MEDYTVIALYEDNLQKYAGHFTAPTPEGAAERAQRQARVSLYGENDKSAGEPLIIAGVVEGTHEMLL